MSYYGFLEKSCPFLIGLPISSLLITILSLSVLLSENLSQFKFLVIQFLNEKYNLLLLGPLPIIDYNIITLCQEWLICKRAFLGILKSLGHFLVCYHCVLMTNQMVLYGWLSERTGGISSPMNQAIGTVKSKGWFYTLIKGFFHRGYDKGV